MRRQDKFLASLALYAIDLSSLKRRYEGITSRGDSLYRYMISVVWFRRRHGLDTANAGGLWTYSTDLHEEGDESAARGFLVDTLTDGRCGAGCRSRWDGERLWSEPSVTLAQAEEDAAFLRSMLDAVPQIPAGYDGWWRF